MDRERWSRLEDVFARATDVAADQRDAFVARECGGDLALRRQVERLLAADATGGPDELDLVSPPWSPDGDAMVGRQVGNYRITARIAAGGMGVVYRAERTDGVFAQEVAIKLLRVEAPSGDELLRFERERRTLAALHHPNIARVFDGGTTDRGTPYLVMELIDGEPLDRWCEGRAAGLGERLRLFAQVCRAVHFAHQSLVVHRDIKPANVLVDRHGVPKLLDFGIARLLEHDEDGPAVLPTQTRAVALTREFASPEQLRAERLTTATDIYSLGVTLYTLLTGASPFPRGTRTPTDWERAVLVDPPPRPSTAVRPPFASACGTTPARLHRSLRGDLDRIVLMALRKEPERRYGSALMFAEDVERYLAGLPVRARGDSLPYRLRKLVARHRVAFASALLLLVGTALVFALTWRAERRAREEAVHARIEADSTARLLGFVTGAFLQSGGLDGAAARERAADTLLQRARQVRRQFADQPHLRANLLDGLGRTCAELGFPDRAETLAREALALRCDVFGRDTLEVALSLGTLGELALQRGAAAEAIELLERALALHRSLPDEVHTDVARACNDLAVALRRAGDADRAERLHREALALRRADDDGSPLVAESLNNLAGIHLGRGEYARAAELLGEALAIRRAVLGDDHPLTLQALSNRAIALAQGGEAEAALASLAEAESGYRALRAAGTGDLAHVLVQKAALLTRGEDLRGARAAIDEAVAVTRDLLGPDHPRLAAALLRLAIVQRQQGETDAARATWDEVLRIRRATLPPVHPAWGGIHRDHGVFLLDAGDLAGAKAALQRAVDVLAAQDPPEPLDLGTAEASLGRCLLDLGEADAAVAWLRRGWQRLVAARGAESAEAQQARRMLDEAERR